MTCAWRRPQQLLGLSALSGFACGGTSHRARPLPSWMTELERSHDELRAALIVAGKHIRKLAFDRKDDSVLQLLRRVLRNTRAVRKAARPVRLRIPLARS